MSEHDWRFIEASEYCKKITDGTHDSPKRTEVGKPLVTSKHIKGREIDFENTYLISEADYQSINKRSKVNQWDVIISMIGEYCGFCYIERNKEINYTVKNVGLYKAGSKLNAEWLYYYINSPIGKAYLSRSKSGASSQPYLTLGGIRSLPILVISSEHKKQQIISVLSALDAKIELNNRINAELEAMAKTLYDYWFVQFDFPDENGKPYKSSGGKMVYNETLKREIPDGWEVSSLSSILKSNYSSIGKNDEFEEIKYLDTSSITKNKIGDAECLNSKVDKIPSRAKRIVHVNDILYSTVRPNLCHYGIIKHPVKNMVASTGFVQLSSKVDWISNDFIYTFLTSSWVTARLQTIAALAVSAYPSISPNDILELNIALPRTSKMVEYLNDNLDTIYSKISLNQKENQQLAEIRDWLLPMLMNGQVTVK